MTRAEETITDYSILIIEDDEGLNKLIHRTLKRAGYNTIQSLSGKDGLEKARKTENIILLLDYILSDMTAENLIKELLKDKPDIPFLIMTGHGDEKIAVQMMKLGARDYLSKKTGFLDLLPEVIKQTLSKIVTENRLAHAENELIKKGLQQESISETARYLTESLVVEEVLERIGQKAKEIVLADGCAIYMVNDDQKTLRPVVAIEEPYSEQIMSTIININESFTGKAIVEQKVLIFNDADEQQGGKQIPGTPEEHEHIIVAPFMIKNKAVGAMCLNNLKSPFNDDDKALIETFAIYASTALKNAQMYDSLRQEVEERIKAENALRTSEERYRSLFNSGHDAIFVQTISADGFLGNFVEVNDIACKRLGYSREELQKLSFINLCPSVQINNLPDLLHELHSQKHLLWEMEHVSKDGQVFPVEINSLAIFMDDKPAVLSIARDITERLRMEEEITKSQKLESIGTLAGGIAHDFNNRLSIILGNTQLAAFHAEQGNDISKYLKNIEHSTEQATTLTQQLLTFSKGGEPIKKVYAIDSLLKESVELSLSGSKLKSEFSIQHDLWSAEVDKGQFNQVINNIVINAIQATPDGGRINIKASNVTSGILVEPNLKDDKYIKIQIIDHGVGIPTDQISKIFDPYFTTKAKGNGLGLATSFSIIKRHNGLIKADSTTGIGTTFTIFLPAANKRVNRSTQGDAMSLSGSGKILIMDDEEMFRKMVGDFVTHMGYSAVLAEKGEDAVSEFVRAKNSNDPFDAIILDLTVPGGMGGKETMQKILEIDPMAKGIVSSGYSNDPVMAQYQKFGFSGIVAKPYQMSDLAKVLSTVIFGEDS